MRNVQICMDGFLPGNLNHISIIPHFAKNCNCLFVSYIRFYFWLICDIIIQNRLITVILYPKILWTFYEHRYLIHKEIHQNTDYFCGQKKHGPERPRILTAPWIKVHDLFFAENIIPAGWNARAYRSAWKGTPRPVSAEGSSRLPHHRPDYPPG